MSLTTAGAGDFPGYSIEPTIKGAVSSLPGEVVTFGVRVSNTDDAALRSLLFVDLPSGWKTLLAGAAFDLNSGSQDVRLISFAVPEVAPAGRYEITVYLRAVDSGIQLAQMVLFVDIVPSRKLLLTPLHLPGNSVAGTPYTATFRLQNLSNEAGRIGMRVRNSPEFMVQLDTVNLVLHPGEERDIHVTVQTEILHGTKYRHALELFAFFLADPETEVRASGLITVLQTKTFIGETIRFPVQITYRNTGENGISGSQAELFGVGSLTEAGQNRYEILLRGPDNRTQSLLGLRDEYRFMYESEYLDLTVGDQPFRLTPLTELGRYAVGAAARGRVDEVTVGGFINRTRWSPTNAEEAAGFASYRFNPDLKVGLNFLQKRDARISDILTIQTEIGILERADASIEFGRSRSTGERGNGLALQIRSRPDWIQYGFNMIYAEPKYHGYYRDFDAKSFNVAVFPWDKLRFEGYYTNDIRNLDRDPSQLHAPQNRRLQIGVGFGHYSAVYLKLVRYKDLLPVPKYDRQERSVVLNLGTYYQSGSISATLDVGRTEELLLNRSYPLRRFSLSARFQPDADQGYSTSIEYGSTKDLFSNEIRQGTSWNVSAWFRLFRTLQVRAGIYESWTISPVRQRNTLADAGFDFTLPFGHLFSVMGRINTISSSINRDNLAYSVEYTVPLTISISKAIDGGELSGIVYDQNTGRGIANIIVYAGEAVAVTDESGGFEFQSLTEGTYVVSIDRGGIGPDRITTTPLPLQAGIHPDIPRFLEIGVTHSGSIRGLLRRQEPDSGEAGPSSAGPKRDLGGVTIEIRREEEMFRRVTDARGRFDFSDLRPGRWTVSVLEENIPGGLGIGTPEMTIDLLPGENHQTIIEVAPVQRRIRMLQEGTLLRPEGRKGN